MAIKLTDVYTGTFDVDGSFKADGESTESKHVTLRFRFNAVTVKDIMTRACAQTKITWVNNVGRKSFDKIKDRSVIEVDFSSPAKKVETREEKFEKAYNTFRQAGLPEDQAKQLATKVVDNPELVS